MEAESERNPVLNLAGEREWLSLPSIKLPPKKIRHSVAHPLPTTASRDRSSMASARKMNKTSSSQLLGAPAPRTEADKHADEIFTQALAITFNALIDQGKTKEEAQAFVTSEEGKSTLLSVAKRLMIDRLSEGAGDDDDDDDDDEEEDKQQQQQQQQEFRQQQATATTQAPVPANASPAEAREIRELSTELARLKQLQEQLKGLQQMAGAEGSNAGFRGADGGANAMSNLHNLRKSPLDDG